MSDQKKFSSEIIKIIAKAIEDKIYGSIEIYFEAGKTTQVTQRVIKKIDHMRKETYVSRDSHSYTKKPEEVSDEDVLHFPN